MISQAIQFPTPEQKLSTGSISQLSPENVGGIHETPFSFQKSLLESSPPSSKTSSTQHQHDNTKNVRSSSSETTFYHRGETAISIVVCGVDGTVYTLDAYTGHLRGMFTSGPAIFDPSAENDYDDGGAKECNANTEEDCASCQDYVTSNNFALTASRERILPGLNGYLYKISESISSNIEENEDAIQELFSAKDVVDFPISACPENIMNGEQTQHQQDGCGIIIASKKTTIFAIDPTTGKVRWTQDPHGEAGGRGFNVARGHTVLLQREDYVVRHLDAQMGNQVWKLKLGQFSPLGFDMYDESSNEDGSLFSIKPQSAATMEGVKLLNGKNHGYLTFGKDGASLMAADGISGEVLWSRRIDSDIAAIHGIGTEGKWVTLDTFDIASEASVEFGATPSTKSDDMNSRIQKESNRISRHGSHSYVMTEFKAGSSQYHLGAFDKLQYPQLESRHFNEQGLLKRDDHYLVATKPNLSSLSSTKRIGRLIPFGAGQSESRNQLHRLGRHDSLLFINPFDLNNRDFPQSMQIAQGYHDPFPLTPFSLSMSDIRPPVSHRTEHGVYLTWSMVASVVVILISAIVFFARIIILRQKRKWERKLKHNKITDKQNEINRLTASQTQSLNTQSLSGNRWPQRYLPVTRSFSLGAIRTHSFSARPTFTERRRSDQIGDFSTTQGASTPAASPSNAQSKTIVNDDISSNLDGIPLVRYSRYTSEFKEVVALGRGGFGTVFRCRNVLDGREYAIKKVKISSPLSGSGNVTKNVSQKLHRVLREVKCLALLDHPNIVRYYTSWLEVDNGNYFDDDETNTISSVFDPNSLVSGMESVSRVMSQSLLRKNKHQQRQANDLKDRPNPLGWNEFASLQLDESKSEASFSCGARVADASKAVSIDGEEDDLGFTWERSKENSLGPSLLNSGKQPLNTSIIGEKHSGSLKSVVDKNSRLIPPASPLSTKLCNEIKKKCVMLPQAPSDKTNGKIPMARHILFIQMQLCSVQTLADFLANHEARGCTAPQTLTEESQYAVDIPLAIRLFAQIAHGVKYVHKQGLIHRDLKPQNCFIDDTGIVKVGDFGLSRESSAVSGVADFDQSNEQNDSFSSLTKSDAENTIGVGTRAYASPEQIRGSQYDASTDVFSLGLILFELCYPMYTSMERYKEFGGIRKGFFPAYWLSHVQTLYPTLHDLLVQMISEIPSDRPSADAVSDHIDSLLRQHSTQSLDKSWGDYFYALDLLRLRSESVTTRGGSGSDTTKIEL